MTEIVTQLPPQSVWLGIGLLVSAVVALGGGRMQRVPSAEILAIFGLSIVVGAASSRILWLLTSPDIGLGVAWEHLGRIIDPRHGGYSSFGALAGAAVAVGIWWRSHKDEPWAPLALDALVLAGLTGLALARLGCLANGCDFGAPSEAAWALEYPAGSYAHLTHVQRGLVALDAPTSAPVHPFPLYMALGTLGVVLAGGWTLWRRWVSPGWVAVGAAGAYFVWRFAMEWTRDPSTVMRFAGEWNVHHVFAVLALGVVFMTSRRLRPCRLTVAEAQLGREK